MASQRASGKAEIPLRMFLGAGHLLLLAGFFLPWVGGAFGARSGLSGFDLAAIARDVATLEAYDVSGEARGVMFALYALPALALDGLLVAAFGARMGIPERALRRLAQLLALPALVVATAVAVVSIFGARSSMLLDGPAYGLYIELAAAGTLLLTALASPLAKVQRSLRRRRPMPRAEHVGRAVGK